MIGEGIGSERATEQVRPDVRSVTASSSSRHGADLLTVDDLTVVFGSKRNRLEAVADTSVSIGRGEFVAVVGESGSGKSTLLLAMLGMVRRPGRIVKGDVQLEGTSLLHGRPRDLRRIRGRRIAMVFQDPSSGVDPLYTVGAQIAETLAEHDLVSSRDEGMARAQSLLESVGIADAERRVHQYPFQFSGGMLQRAMIALALSCRPDVILADEPTTNLDATTQAQILELLARRAAEESASLVLATHNLGVVARYATRVFVMYRGRVVESGQAEEVFARPRHPYTRWLLDCVPRLDRIAPAVQEDSDVTRPTPSPAVVEQGPGCAYLGKCAYAQERCRLDRPLLRAADGDHEAACHVDIGVAPPRREAD